MFQPARQRLSFESDGNQISVVNGLGGTIRQLAYREGENTYVLEAEVAAGDRAPLKLDTKGNRPISKGVLDSLKLTPITPIKFQQVFDRQPEGTYLAVLETSPFWDPGVENVREAESLHVVFGFRGEQP